MTDKAMFLAQAETWGMSSDVAEKEWSKRMKISDEARKAAEDAGKRFAEGTSMPGVMSYAFAEVALAGAIAAYPIIEAQVMEGLRDPTDEMVIAAQHDLDTPFYADIERIYRVMIAAAIRAGGRDG